MKPIYEPKGKAKEYGDLSINIYTGCPHRCFYCFAPNVLHRDREKFHSEIKPIELREFTYWLGFVSDYTTDNHGRLKRPPQSWMYVE